MKFLIVLFLPMSIYAQVNVTGSIKNNRNEPLPFTTVISVHEQRGTITDESGHFIISTKITDSLRITNIAYKPITIAVIDVALTNTITLIDSFKTLEHVVLKDFSYFKNEKEVGFHRLKKNFGYKLRGGHQLAVYIENTEKKEGWIREVFFGVKLFDECKNDFRLRLLGADTHTNSPAGDLLYENVIIRYSELKRKNTIDISQYKTLFPVNGIYVLLEWLNTVPCLEKHGVMLDGTMDRTNAEVWMSWNNHEFQRIPVFRPPHLGAPAFGMRVFY
jgi:hypothetical protein